MMMLQNVNGDRTLDNINMRLERLENDTYTDDDLDVVRKRQPYWFIFEFMIGFSRN